MEILKKKKKKGFTLIELLVVIAIIGILASIVLVSVNSARGRARDSAVQSNVSSVRAEAEMIFDDTSAYTTVCADATHLNATGNLAALQAGIVANTPGNALPICQAGVTAAGVDHYCVEATLNNTAGGGFFCADDTGYSGKQAATGCDGTNYNCAVP